MSLYKRGNVYWSYFYIDGVRQQHSTGASNRRSAELVERKLKDEANLRQHQIVVADPDLTFGELTAKFLAAGCATAFHLDRLKHLLPQFENLPLVRITKAAVREYRTSRWKQKPRLTDATLNRDAAVLRHMLYWAVEESLLLSNPLARLGLVKERRVKRSVLTTSEEEKLLSVAPEHLRRMILAALYCGLRRGEVLNQQWDDIDMERRLLFVTKSKTAGGERREIPLPGIVYEMLLSIRRREQLVFTYRGKGIAHYKTAWNSAVKNALDRHFLFHELRHSYNTRMLEAGVMQEVRRALMGHSTGKDVNSIYTHIETPLKRAAVAKLEMWVQKEKQKLQLKGGSHDSAEIQRADGEDFVDPIVIQ